MLPCVCGVKKKKKDGVGNAFVLFIRHGTATKDNDERTAVSAEVFRTSAKSSLNLHFAFLSL